MKREAPDRRKKYRLKQISEGKERIEFWVNQKTKELFDQMVTKIADELMNPYSERDRRAKAKTILFDQLVNGVWPKFIHMREEIEGLKEELKATAPAFFDLDKIYNDTPLPHTINQLPDDPKKLKILLSKTFIQAQEAEKKLKHCQYWLNRKTEMAEASQAYVSKLKGKLKSFGVDIDKESLANEDNQ